MHPSDFCIQTNMVMLSTLFTLSSTLLTTHLQLSLSTLHKLSCLGHLPVPVLTCT